MEYSNHLQLQCTNEFAHLEMIATMIYKLTKDATPEQMKAAGLSASCLPNEPKLAYPAAICSVERRA